LHFFDYFFFFLFFLFLLGGGGAHEVLNLTLSLLGLGEVAEALLADLDGTLFLSDTEEFDDTLVELGEAGDFTDDGLNGAEALLGEGEAGLAGDGAGARGGLETVVETADDAVLLSAGLGSLTLASGHCTFFKKDFF
jgi:hypothetical protein